MSDSDNEYVASGSSADERDHNVGEPSTTAQRAPRTARKRQGEERLDGRMTSRPKAQQARWERSLNALADRDLAVEDGKLLAENLARIQEAQKRARIRQDTQPFQRGIIRHLVLVLDVSEAMLDRDWRPNRFRVMLRFAEEYIREFFEQNPISQLTVLAMHDGKCIKVSELSGNPNDHISAIRGLVTGGAKENSFREPKGSPSLQNALQMSRAMLYHTPKHGTREVLVILGALLTNDPGDIHQTIAACAKDKLRVSIIGIAARMKICQDIVSATNDGDESAYTVAIDEIDLRQLLMSTTAPPVMRAGEQEARAANLLVMGFPSRMEEDHPSLCACHGTFTRGGYTCPRCRTKVCSLPQTCPACALTLILSTHLARSYHHLFPLRNWTEVSWRRAQEMGSLQCKGCLIPFPLVPDTLVEKDDASLNRDDDVANGRQVTSKGIETKQSKLEGSSESARYECQSCHNHFCVDCDVFCHQTLFNCPGCQSGQPIQPISEFNGTTGGEPMVVDA